MGKRRGNHEGSIYQRQDGLWCARVSVGGRRLTAYRKTQREAREWIREALAQVATGLTVERSRATVGEYLRYWLEMSRPTLRPKTSQQYEQIVQQHIAPDLGAVRLKDVRPDHVQALYNRRLAAGVGRRTVRLVHAVLHRAFGRAVRWGLMGRNPADAVDKPQAPHREMRVLTVEQVRALLDAARGHRLEALFHLALSIGLREGELLGLMWSDIDWQERTLQVQRQVQRVTGQGKLLVEPKTKAGRRVVALGEQDLAQLREQRRRQATERLFAGAKWQDGGLVFATTIGTMLEQSKVYKQFRALLGAAGLPAIRFHDLRHTSATIQLAAGIPANVVQQRLGHASIDMTLGIYAHVIREMQQDAAERMDRVLRRG